MALKHVAVLATAFLLTIAGSPANSTAITIFDDLSDPSINNRSRSVGNSITQPDAASFFTPGFTGSIQSLVLALDCNKTDGSSASCGSGSFGNTAANRAVVTNSNQVPLTSVTGITIGSLIKINGTLQSVYVTAVDTTNKIITLSGPISLSSSASFTFLPQGSFTVSLFANSSLTGIPGSALKSSDLPAGSALGSFSVFDAALYLQDSAIAGANPNATVDFTFDDPFNVELSPNTAYWIELTNGGDNDPTQSNIEWRMLLGNSGTNVSTNYFTDSLDGSSANCGGSRCSWLNGGSSDPFTGPSSYGMEITYVPEPSSFAMLAIALLGIAGIWKIRRS